MTKRTLKGSVVAYTVAIGKGGERKELSEIDGEIFTDPAVVKSTLSARATKMIEKMVAVAQKAAVEWYESPSIDDSMSSIDVEMPQLPSYDEAPQISGDATVMELPDGRLAKVNIKIPDNFS
jgi:hypothetical protein